MYKKDKTPAQLRKYNRDQRVKMRKYAAEKRAALKAQGIPPPKRGRKPRGMYCNIVSIRLSEINKYIKETLLVRIR